MILIEELPEAPITETGVCPEPSKLERKRLSKTLLQFFIVSNHISKATPFPFKMFDQKCKLERYYQQANNNFCFILSLNMLHRNCRQ